jgi:hypothetical protein
MLESLLSFLGACLKPEVLGVSSAGDLNGVLGVIELRLSGLLHLVQSQPTGLFSM